MTHVEEMWEQWRYDISNPDLPEGQLENEGKMSRGSDIVLSIIMDTPSPYYLRGFTGTVFEQNAWTNDRKTLETLSQGAGVQDAFAETDREFLWLSSLYFSDGFMSDSSSDSSGSLSGNSSDISQNVISITNFNADRRYLYLPYECTTLTPVFEQNGIAVQGTGENIYAAGLRGQSVYSCNAYTCLAEVMGDLAEGITADAENGEQDDTSTRVDSQIYKEYEEYVSNTCLTLTREEKEIISSALKEESAGTEVNAVSAARKICRWLEENITYDEEPGNISEDDSFAHWFFQDNRRGYDVHYATAAVMMFRYYGIPARYVEGYLVTAEDVSNAGDSGVVEVTGQDAHAWAEIYLEEVGWIPVEVLEDYEELMGVSYLEGWNVTHIASSRQEEMSTEIDSTETEFTETDATVEDITEESTTATEAGQNNKSDEKRSGKEQTDRSIGEDISGNRMVIYVLYAAIILILAGGVVVAFRFCRNCRLEKKWEASSDYGYCVRMYYFKMCRILFLLEKRKNKKSGNKGNAKGNQMDNDSIEEYSVEDNRIENVKERLIKWEDALEISHMEEAFAIRQKAVYGDRPLTKGERDIACAFFKEEISRLIRKMGRLQRLMLCL